MNPGTPEDLAVLERCWELASRAGSHASDQLASELGRELLGVWPEASLVACLLPNAGRPCLSICRREGQQVSNSLPTVGLDFEGALAGLPLPPGHSFQSARLTTAQGQEAALAAGLPQETHEASLRSARLLSLCCRLLVAAIDHPGAEERERRQIQAEETQLLTDLAVLAGPMTHEFNNFVNIVLLQAAILEAELGATGRQELARLRQHGKTVAGLIQDWHRYRGRQPITMQPLDLHQALRQVVAAWPSPAAAKVRLDLGAEVPPVLATTEDLPRLLRFLLSNALAVSSAVTVRTRLVGETVQLRVEDDGPAVAPERLPHLFEPSLLRPGTVPLELAACEAIVRRRWQARITAENRPEGGLAIIVQLRPALTAS